jgi:hypothetical protein
MVFTRWILVMSATIIRILWCYVIRAPTYKTFFGKNSPIFTSACSGFFISVVLSHVRNIAFTNEFCNVVNSCSLLKLKNTVECR